jgi:hypothetical protein
MKLFVQMALLSVMVIGATVDTLPQQAAPKAPDDVPMGNDILVKLSPPIYPSMARQSNIHGEVAVVVTVHPDGTTDVALENGPPALVQVALDSAKQSRFKCRGCDQALSYRLMYSFRLIRGNKFCAAIAPPTKVIQEPQSSKQSCRPETNIIITTEPICPRDPVVPWIKRGSLKCLYLWNCSKLWLQ